MDKVLKTIKCVECKNTLETPLILPCQHSICQKHVTEKNSGDKLKCPKCGIEHEIPANGFIINEPLCEIIEAKIGSIDFGCVHKEAVDSCDKLDRIIQESEVLLTNSYDYIYDEINKLKNQVNLKRDQLKLKIDEITEDLLKKLNDYQNQCNSSLKTGICLNERIKFESSKNGFLTNLSLWKRKLNEIKVDENKWREISQASNNAINQLIESMMSFKRNLLLRELFDSYKKQVDMFQQMNIQQSYIEPRFCYNPAQDSNYYDKHERIHEYMKPNYNQTILNSTLNETYFDEAND